MTLFLAVFGPVTSPVPVDFVHSTFRPLVLPWRYATPLSSVNATGPTVVPTAAFPKNSGGVSAELTDAATALIANMATRQSPSILIRVIYSLLLFPLWV